MAMDNQKTREPKKMNQNQKTKKSAKKHVEDQKRTNFAEKRNQPYPFASRAFFFGGHPAKQKEK